MERPIYEVADVIRRYGAAFVRTHRCIVTAAVRAVFGDLLNCRTAALGGHRSTCADCQHEEISYNSCRNRHCPKCGASRSARWLADQMEHLLPVPYFHIVFTLPQEIEAIALQNRRVVYGLLFRAASQTLLILARDPRHLDAKIGITAVLHTWGQNLELHPHVHCLVTGGGLTADGKRWVGSRRDFFVSVRVMRKLFRGKFLALLHRAYNNGDLTFHGRIEHLRHPAAFRGRLKPVKKKKWVVYAKAPFAGPEVVLKYLARYTHRVAISNRRILDIRNGWVRFRWRDYRDGQSKTMRLRAAEFLRRLTLHILPKRFQRIRHYGLLANRGRQQALKKCRELLNANGISTAIIGDGESQDDNTMACSKCNSTRLIMSHVARVPMPDIFLPPTKLDTS